MGDGTSWTRQSPRVVNPGALRPDRFLRLAVGRPFRKPSAVTHRWSVRGEVRGQQLLCRLSRNQFRRDRNFVDCDNRARFFGWTSSTTLPDHDSSVLNQLATPDTPQFLTAKGGIEAFGGDRTFSAHCFCPRLMVGVVRKEQMGQGSVVVVAATSNIPFVFGFNEEIKNWILSCSLL